MLIGMKRMVCGFIGNRLVSRHGEMIPQTPSPMEVPAKWVAPHKRARIYLGIYEKDESRLVKEFLSPAIDTIELGCGVGVVSSWVCGKLAPETRYVGVEGNPELVGTAERNIQRFPATALRKIEHGVVSGTYEEGRHQNFYITPGNFHMSSSLRDGERVEVSVPEISLSELLHRHDYSDYQLVSDIEGAEMEILRHDSKALENCQRIIIELHENDVQGNPLQVVEVAESIKALGFKIAKSIGDVYVFER